MDANVKWICMNVKGWKMNMIDMYGCKWWLIHASMQVEGVPEYKTMIEVEGDVRRHEKWGLVSMGWGSLLL